jgi:hypothetical protein
VVQNNLPNIFGLTKMENKSHWWQWQMQLDAQLEPLFWAMEDM